MTTVKEIPLPQPPDDGQLHHVATTATPFRQSQLVDGEEVHSKLFSFPQCTYAPGWAGFWAHFLDVITFSQRRALRTTVEVWLKKTGSDILIHSAQVTLERNNYRR